MNPMKAKTAAKFTLGEMLIKLANYSKRIRM